MIHLRAISNDTIGAESPIEVIIARIYVSPKIRPDRVPEVLETAMWEVDQGIEISRFF
jgi:hypothetical protein